MPAANGVRPSEALTPKERLYVTIYDQAFSNCGKYLAVCNNFGQLVVFNLSTALGSSQKLDDAKRPFFAFRACEKAIYTLVTADDTLVAGSNGSIHAWSWTSLIKKEPKLVWSLALPPSSRGLAEVNSLAVGLHAEKLYAGCGDNDIHVWDITSGTYQGAFVGHQDYVHCVYINCDDRECISASEDGTVRIWDTRNMGREPAHVLEPYKNEKLSRPQMGKWVGCVAADGDWLACGGGPSLAIWHMRSLSPVVILNEVDTFCQKTVLFYQDTVISGGSGGSIMHWYINGDLKNSVPSSSQVVYSIRINENLESCKVLSAAGSTCKVDVCANFGYRAFSFDL